MSRSDWRQDAAREWLEAPEGPEGEGKARREPGRRGSAPKAGARGRTGHGAAARGGARRRNWPLRIGASLLAGMILLALAAPWLGLHDPMAEHAFVRDAAGEFHFKPFGPGEIEGFPLGTDFDGRDILSRLIWGLRPTLVLALLTATIRIGLATTIGTVAGWASGRLAKVFSALMHVTASLPLLVVAIVLLYASGGDMGAGDMILALAATGWSGTAFLVAARVRSEHHAGYIEAARALGAGPLWIVRRHVLPQLAGLLPVLAAFEMAAVLLVLGELGFLGFFLGGGSTRGVARADTSGAWLVKIPGQPELGQMLSVGWENFFQSKWLSFSAGLAFAAAVATFMLVGEGLRRMQLSRERR